MAFTLIQAGTSLIPINADGGVGDALTLPTGVSLSATRIPRFTKFDRFIVLVNTPTKPISIDEYGTARVVTPDPPAWAPTLTNENGGSLSGTYLVKQTFLVKDRNGNVIGESDYGPTSNEKTITTDYLRVDDLPLSTTDTPDGSRLYRTATGPGDEFFKWVDLDGNTQTAYRDDLSDANLSIISGPELGSVPDLTLVVEWNDRLFGVSRTVVDDVRYTQSGTMHAWSALNVLTPPHAGADAAGITGFIPRRGALGVGRRSVIAQITGNKRDNFQCVAAPGGERASLVSQESVIVYKDVAFWLGMDGVYRWDSSGIVSASDDRVRTWFTTDDYFNRSLFYRSFGGFDVTGKKYVLFLAAAGSSNFDRWIELDIATGAWYGPHLTNAFTPSSVVNVAGANGQQYLMIGSREGYLSQAQEDRNDWGLVGVPMSVETKGHDMSEPDLEKHWGELTIHAKPATGVEIDVTPTVGELEATAQDAFAASLADGRVRTYRMGTGKHCSLKFEHETVNEEVVLYGYEINPVHIVGRR